MRKIFLCLALAASTAVMAQEDNKITISGSVQSDMMIAPQKDEAIGAYEDSYDNKNFLTNTYVDILGQSRDIDFGGRFELTQWPMPGFHDSNNDFKGWGLSNAWIKAKGKNAELTLGSFYEQFGSGFILRAYEERTLGVDNSILGARLKLKPFKGVSLTALSGFQRSYWKWEDNLVSGADAELAIDEWIKPWQQKGIHLSIGGSWVNKHENPDDEIWADATHMLKLPEYVNAFDGRIRFQADAFALLAEYATKSQDPNALNNYTYGHGNAAMLSMTYAKKGLSLLAQAKRSENMGFRNKRTASPLCTANYINHLPAFTLDHTYSLAALRPYATQTEGEWAFQGAIGYNFKRKTALGGKYGTKVKLNYSLVRGLENNKENGDCGSDGKDNKFFGLGDVYYQDLNVQFEKRLTKAFDIHLMYMYQQYNQEIIQSHGTNIYSNIFVAEGKYKFNRKYTLRVEGQYLNTKHDSGDWYFGLAELSVAPYLMFSVSDQIGHTEVAQGEYGDIAHYYNAACTFNYKSHRLMLSYGRTRAGFNCTGGVCRFVPASKGITINYNYNF